MGSDFLGADVNALDQVARDLVGARAEVDRIRRDLALGNDQDWVRGQFGNLMRTYIGETAVGEMRQHMSKLDELDRRLVTYIQAQIELSNGGGNGTAAQVIPVQAAGLERQDGGARVVGDRIHLMPKDDTVPSVTIPNHTEADGFQIGPWWNVLDPSHTYRVETETRIPFDRGSELIAREIATHPVPNGDASAATPEGTRNDAAFGQYVRSYTVPSPDPSRYTDIMVNYTINGEHMLHEGYVMRYGERQPDGTVTIVSYGEGNATLQHPMNFPVHMFNNELWERNQEEIEARVNRELGIGLRGSR